MYIRILLRCGNQPVTPYQKHFYLFFQILITGNIVKADVRYSGD